jgi:hypothetical protein
MVNRGALGIEAGAKPDLFESDILESRSAGTFRTAPSVS